MKYDAMGRVIRAVNEDGAVIGYEYDAAGNLLSSTDVLGSKERFTYDALGRTVVRIDRNGGVFKREYDALGRAMTRIDRNGGVFRREYDALGRVVKDIDALGNARTFEYDGTGRITAATDRNGNTTRYELDGMGNIVCQTDSTGHPTRFEYDARGRMTRLLQSRGEGAEPTVTTYAYDGRGLVVREINALGDGKLFVYDGAGNLIQKTDEEGNVTEYEYTAANRIAGIAYADGKAAKFLYNKSGQLIEMDDWNGKTTIERDPLQRVKSVVDAFGREVRYAWDEVGNRTEVVYPDGGSYRYGYDAERHNARMADPAGRETMFRFDAAGNLVEKVYPNGEHTAYAYDPNRRLREMLEFGAGASVPISTQYSWDAQGNRTGETVAKGDGGESAKVFGYDALNRLVRAVEPKGVSEFRYDALGNMVHEAGPEYAREYAYNPMNQLVRREEMPARGMFGEVTGETAGASDPLATVYEYDRRGNRVRERRDGTGEVLKEFGYDSANRMVRGSGEKGVSCYHYDALNRRVGRETQSADGREANNLRYIVDFTSRRNDDLGVSAEGFFRQSYVYANNQRILQTTAAWEGSVDMNPLGVPGELFIHEDIMGSARQFSEADIHEEIMENIARVKTHSSISVTTNEYDVWGVPITSSSQARFTTYDHDDILDLYFAQYRFYDSGNRVFTQEDPSRSSSNWYAYCQMNPSTFTDPLGLEIIVRADDEYGPEKLIEFLNELSDDSFDVKPSTNGGAHAITYTPNNGMGKPVGTNLVRELIDSDYGIIVIQSSSHGGGTASAITYDNSYNGIGTGTVIRINPDIEYSLPTYIDGKGITKNISTPKYIELGHEFIHAYNNSKGEAQHYDKIGWSAVKENNGVLTIYVTKAEELRTAGIGYYDVLEFKIDYMSVRDESYRDKYDFSHVTQNFHGANEAKYTENKLRAENGLGRRTSYIQLPVDSDATNQETFGDWWERLWEGRV